MQINISATLPSAAAEPAAAGTDHVQDGSAGSFFAHMDQIWNAKTGQDGSVEKKDDKTSTKAEGNPLMSLMLASLVPPKMEVQAATAILPNSGENISSESASDAQVSAPCPDSDQRLIPISIKTDDEPLLSHTLALVGKQSLKNTDSSDQPEKTDTAATANQSVSSFPGVVIAAASQPGNPLSNEAAADIPADFCFDPGLNPDVQPVPKGQDSLSRSKMEGNKLQADSPVLPKERMSAQMPDGTESADKKAVDPAPITGKSGCENPEINARDNSGLDSDPIPELTSKAQPSLGKPEIYAALKNSSPAIVTIGREVLQVAAEPGHAPATVELSQGISSRSEYAPHSESQGPPLSLPISDNTDARQDTPQISMPGKFESIAQAALDNTGAGNDPAGQESQRSDPDSWSVPKTRQDDSRVDFSKSWTPLTERQQDISAQSISSPAHSSDIGNNVISARPEAAPSQPKEFISQLAERMQVQMQDGKEEIRIQLKPDMLGHLEIRAESTANGVVARIVAESGNVKNYLESNLHLLHQSLQDQGLKVDRIQVTIQESSPSFSGSLLGHSAQSGNSGSGYHGRGTGKPSDISSSQPEELNVDPTTWLSLNPNTRFHTVA